MPSRSGIMTSRRMSAGFAIPAILNPESPSEAARISCPLRSKASLRSPILAGLSSMIRIFSGVMMRSAAGRADSDRTGIWATTRWMVFIS